MSNPRQILAALDRHLERPTRIILYGRAALALGFAGADAVFGATVDVDAYRGAVLGHAIWAAVDQTGNIYEVRQSARQKKGRGLMSTALG